MREEEGETVTWRAVFKPLDITTRKLTKQAEIAHLA
jgi:hypothetical protein